MNRDNQVRAEAVLRRQEDERRYQERRQQREQRAREHEEERQRQLDRHWYRFEPHYEEVWSPEEQAEIDRLLGQRPGWYQDYWN